MKIAMLRQRFDRLPMLRVLLPLTVGILGTTFGILPLWFLAGAFVVSGVAAVWGRSSLWTGVLLLVTGFATAQLRAPQIDVPRNLWTLFEVTIEDFPASRGGYSIVEARIDSWRNPTDGSWHASTNRIRLYTDSLTRFEGNERIRCYGWVRPIHDTLGGYRQQMTRRGFCGTMRIDSSSIADRLPSRGHTLHEKAVERLNRLPLPTRSAPVVHAMSIGNRTQLLPERQSRYARSGLSHLLAVSGLHTGILFVVIHLLLRWMPILRHGQRWRNLAVIVLIWSYVAVAGFPPSAVRTAVMCTLLQTALASNSHYEGMNALAAAAVGMLLWNPNYLYDIGFQLSFVAVGAILVWGVPLCVACRTHHRAIDFGVHSYLVCLTATFATAPLISHSFGIISPVGLLLSPLAVALASVIITSGVLWVVLPWGTIGKGWAVLTDWTVVALEELSALADRIPGGWFAHRLSTEATAAFYLVFAVATLLWWCREPKKSVHLSK